MVHLVNDGTAVCLISDAKRCIRDFLGKIGRLKSCLEPVYLLLIIV